MGSHSLLSHSVGPVKASCLRKQLMAEQGPRVALGAHCCLGKAWSDVPVFKQEKGFNH